MSRKVFTSHPTRHPLSPLKARDAEVRILEITRAVSTCLPQLWAEITSFSAGLALMNAFVGDKVRGLVGSRYRTLVGRDLSCDRIE